MKLELEAPEDFVGAVIGALKLRRGVIQGQEVRNGRVRITAIVPAANLFEFADVLARQAENKGSLREQFDHYAPVPPGADGPDVFPPAVGMRA